MTEEILMAAAQMTPNDLKHHGVKGQKWGVRRTSAELAAASGGPGGGASVENVEELEESIDEAEQKLAEMKADGADEKEIRAMEASIKAGKEKVNQILDAERRNGAAFEHAMSFTPDEVFIGLAEDELFFEHHGIKGQKWGIRRFQPYRQGMKVAGGKVVGAAKKVKQRFKDIGDARQKKKAAKVKAKAVKKAQATRKANANFEAEKKKAIESGSIEDLAKFKGKLTNEEYTKAFIRLQNEKKMSDMVAANQKTVWDTIDKGMSIVQKVGGYANTIATAKENFNKLNDTLHKAEKEAAKEQATLEKNKFITNIENITELNRGMDKHKLTPQEYQQAMNILANKKLRQGKDDNIDQDFVDQDKKAAKEKAAKEQADRDRWTAEQNFKDFQKRQAKEAKKQAKEAWKQYQKEANAPKDGEWWEDKSASSSKTENAKSPEQRTNQLLLTMKDVKPSSASTDSGKKTVDEFYDVRMANVRATYGIRETVDKPANQLLLTMKDTKPSSASTDSGKKTVDEFYDVRMANVRATYGIRETVDKPTSSSNGRTISGAKTGQAGTTYKQQADLNFGNSSVKKYSAKPSEPSKIVTDTRKTVADTQAEAARQREVDEKRKKALGK